MCVHVFVLFNCFQVLKISVVIAECIVGRLLMFSSVI